MGRGEGFEAAGIEGGEELAELGEGGVRGKVGGEERAGVGGRGDARGVGAEVEGVGCCWGGWGRGEEEGEVGVVGHFVLVVVVRREEGW